MGFGRGGGGADWTFSPLAGQRATGRDMEVRVWSRRAGAWWRLGRASAWSERVSEDGFRLGGWGSAHQTVLRSL